MSLAAAPLPSGRVTFVFTDVVGSTRTFVEHGEAYAEALTALHATTADHAARQDGVVVETEGDGAFLAFPDAISAVEALIALQEELETSTRPGLRLRIRAGAHTGDAVPVGGHYLALAVYVAARVSAAANAGQLLVTEALVEDLKASGSARVGTAVDVGNYSMKDIADPVRLWRLAGDAAPPRATPARRTNVQQSRTSFVARDQDVDHLRELVANPGLVTAVGPGGVGKTRLASEFALRDAEAFPGGAWLVELSTLDTPDQVVGAAGAAVGLNSADVEGVVAELRRRGRTLLVLDNCEHLVDPVVELVQALLDGCPELTVLCTSREALHIAEERVWAVPPLPAGEPSIQLFVERSQSAHARGLDPDLVREICLTLDGLPLAIELAASQTREEPLKELLEAVQSGRDPLARRGGHERQRSLDAILQWSLDRLAPELRDSLLVLAVFPGRFTPAMARTVLAAVRTCDASATKELVRRSLVDLHGDDYRLLITVRNAARRLLVQDPELHRNALDALVEWTGAYGAERWELPSFHDDVPPDTLLAVEAGLARALDVGLRGLGKAWAMTDVISGVRGASEALVATADRALDLPAEDPDTVLALAAADRISGLHGGSKSLSADQIAEMIRIGRGSGDPRLLERMLRASADHEDAADNLLASRAHRTEILDLVQSTPRLSFLLSSALTGLANNYFWAGDRSMSMEYDRQAVEASRAAAQWSGHATANLNLAEAYLLEKRPGEARDCALTALKTAAPDWRLRCTAMSYIARSYAQSGDRESALAAGREALPELRRLAVHSRHSATDLAGLLDDIPELRDIHTPQ